MPNTRGADPAAQTISGGGPESIIDAIVAESLFPGHLGFEAGQVESILNAVPIPIYLTDAVGKITFYNEAAVDLWGRLPISGKDTWCGAGQIFREDGSRLPHDQCAAALAVRTGKPVHGVKAFVERPDVSRVPVVHNAIPLIDVDGLVTGAFAAMLTVSAETETLDAKERDRRHRGAFMASPMAMWEGDFSAAKRFLDELRQAGVTDLQSYLGSDPDRLEDAVDLIQVTDVNHRAAELFEADDCQALLAHRATIFLPETKEACLGQLLALWDGRPYFESETAFQTLKGRRIEALFRVMFSGDYGGGALISLQDVTEKNATKRALEAQRRRLAILNRFAQKVSSNLDLDSVVQDVTDIATNLIGAEFGAFFYNVTDENGEGLLLYALSGAPREAFEKFGMPRNTPLFELTFRGDGVLRSDDIQTDPRYGKNAPHHGMPEGHLPVRSYLAAPVLSRKGEVVGAMFFGHPEPAQFDEESERLIGGIAVHTAVAIDNAYLHEEAQREIAARKAAEHDAQRLAAIVEQSDDAIVSKDLNGIILTWNRGAELLYGYAAKDVIGRPMTIVMPDDRMQEETEILSRIQRGEAIKAFETVRRRKDGHLIDISLAVSPVKDVHGNVVGVSSIGRDISDQKLAQQRQTLLLREMSHRLKNLLTVTGSLMSLSARHAESPEDLAKDVQGRLAALTRAHELTRPGLLGVGDDGKPVTTLQSLIEAILAPYLRSGATSRQRFAVAGDDIVIREVDMTNLALVLHEFATNAAKYGALACESGALTIDIQRGEDGLSLTWRETSERGIAKKGRTEGFGSELVNQIVTKQFQGSISREWEEQGLRVRLFLPLSRLGA